MARKRTKAAKQAQALLVWLETLDLPTRVINALRRDLEVVTGEREGEDGGGALAGFDQARFAEELYRPRGGQIGKVPSVAASAIEALRAAIPAPASNGDSDALQPAKDDEVTAAPADIAPGGAEAEPSPQEDEEAAEAEPSPQEDEEAAEAEPSPQEDEEAAEPVNATLEGAEATPAAEPEGAEAVPAADEALEAAPEGPSADVAQDAAAEPGEAPVAPAKRRGRPPRAALEGAEPAVTPAKRPGRRPREENAPATPAARGTAAHLEPLRSAPPTEAATAALAAPAASPAADPSFGVMLRLWRELHPQGQRAAMRFMASLVGEG